MLIYVARMVLRRIDVTVVSQSQLQIKLVRTSRLTAVVKSMMTTKLSWVISHFKSCIVLKSINLLIIGLFHIWDLIGYGAQTIQCQLSQPIWWRTMPVARSPSIDADQRIVGWIDPFVVCCLDNFFPSIIALSEVVLAHCYRLLEIFRTQTRARTHTYSEAISTHSQWTTLCWRLLKTARDRSETPDHERNLFSFLLYRTSNSN